MHVCERVTVITMNWSRSLTGLDLVVWFSDRERERGTEIYDNINTCFDRKYRHTMNAKLASKRKMRKNNDKSSYNSNRFKNKRKEYDQREKEQYAGPCAGVCVYLFSLRSFTFIIYKINWTNKMKLGQSGAHARKQAQLMIRGGSCETFQKIEAYCAKC